MLVRFIWKKPKQMALRVFRSVSRHAARYVAVRSWNASTARALSVSMARLAAEKAKVTHTGQVWEESDYRNIRFIGKEKQINEKFAIDLVAEEPVVVVKGNHTWCDGGRGALGHPKVYINLDKPETNVCGYCGKRFVAQAHKELFKDEIFTDE